MEAPNYLNWGTEGLMDLFRGESITLKKDFSDVLETIAGLKNKAPHVANKTIVLTDASKLFFNGKDNSVLSTSDLVKALKNALPVITSHFHNLDDLVVPMNVGDVSKLETTFLNYTKHLGHPDILPAGLVIKTSASNKDKPDLKMLYESYANSSMVKSAKITALSSELDTVIHLLSGYIKLYDSAYPSDENFHQAHNRIIETDDTDTDIFIFVDKYVPEHLNVCLILRTDSFHGGLCNIVKWLIDFIIQSICQETKHIVVKFK